MLLKKVLLMIFYNSLTWEELDYIAKFLINVDKDEVIKVFRYSKYFDFMSFRSLFLQGVEERDKDKILKAYRLFSDNLYKIAKEYVKGSIQDHAEVKLIRKKLGLSKLNVA